MKILVVEDDEMVRTMIRRILESEGHEVLTASNGERAVAILSSNRISVMITDIIMPFKEGMETIIECRRQWRDVKIIAISGGGRAAIGDFLDMARKFGADEVLKKPLRPEKLIATVESLAG